MNHRTHIRVERIDYSQKVGLRIWQTSPEGKLALAEPLTFTTYDNPNLVPCTGPVLELAPEEAQSFMDELWRAGFRPTQGTGSAGALAATQLHLEDTRSMLTKCMDTILTIVAPKP